MTSATYSKNSKQKQDAALLAASMCDRVIVRVAVTGRDKWEGRMCAL